MNSENIFERVRSIIVSNRYLTMATYDGQKPWAAALAYVVYPDYSFVYYSAIDTRTQQGIARSPIVACTIYDSSLPSDDADGIQFSASVSEIPEDKLEAVMSMYFQQSFPDEEVRKNWVRPVQDFKNPAIQRFYRITPLDMFTLDLNSLKVDRRVEVPLEELKKVPMLK